MVDEFGDPGVRLALPQVDPRRHRMPQHVSPDGLGRVTEEHVRPRLHLVRHEDREVVQFRKLVQYRDVAPQLLLPLDRKSVV